MNKKINSPFFVFSFSFLYLDQGPVPQWYQNNNDLLVLCLIVFLFFLNSFIDQISSVKFPIEIYDSNNQTEIWSFLHLKNEAWKAFLFVVILEKAQPLYLRIPQSWEPCLHQSVTPDWPTTAKWSSRAAELTCSGHPITVKLSQNTFLLEWVRGAKCLLGHPT